MTFKDHFSGHAAAYAQHRPLYPPPLFDWLAGLCRERRHALDCATGNGQAARELARHFERVTATDASAEQIAAAAPLDGVDFRTAPAESSGLPDASVDLVTVAQALHWFDVAAFYAEAARVLREDGVLAAWCYQLTSVTPAIDAIIQRYYADTVGGFWPPERVHIERGYADIAPAWPAIAAPAFEMRCDWTADAMLGYLGSWSATQRAAAATGEDPLAAIRSALRDAWGGEPRPVRWPLVCRVFRRPPGG
jgi:SAM-dependent methyltransferase